MELDSRSFVFLSKSATPHQATPNPKHCISLMDLGQTVCHSKTGPTLTLSASTEATCARSLSEWPALAPRGYQLLIALGDTMWIEGNQMLTAINSSPQRPDQCVKSVNLGEKRREGFTAGCVPKFHLPVFSLPTWWLICWVTLGVMCRLVRGDKMWPWKNVAVGTVTVTGLKGNRNTYCHKLTSWSAGQP